MLELVPECCKTQKMYVKAFNNSFLALIYFLDWCKTQEMCGRIVSDGLFSIRYFPDQFKTEQMCNEALDDCLAALKFVPDWLLKVKWLKTYYCFYADENILYFNEDSGNVIFSCNGMGILYIRLNNINVDDINYDAYDPDTNILVRLLAWHIKFENCKALKKELNEELMEIAWHPKRCWNFCMSQDEKKNI